MSHQMHRPCVSRCSCCLRLGDEPKIAAYLKPRKKSMDSHMEVAYYEALTLGLVDAFSTESVDSSQLREIKTFLNNGKSNLAI
ncbi:hypothetical protein JTE90_006486 [Oedothorax gibbosus]|uniref:Uncharacterized protein n=1 Tax=Oedothorax gibbosus TaxID=931172 RepID=A0AAV6VMT2_9ARAC|nr:hypothetical protein JTE90_006486 [Oedothorax gibbosus]